MKKKGLIVALDVDNRNKALQLAEALKKEVKFFKVGLELFSACGPAIVDDLNKKSFRVFLDLKFHDIPNTVAGAARAVTKLGAAIFNVHALGGYDMMEQAAKSAAAQAKESQVDKPAVLAVTILTSMDEDGLKRIGIGGTVSDAVIKLARMAKEAGLDGVVASPKEAGLIRNALGGDFVIVTPGVRPAWADPADQKRISTPAEAVKNGADFIVVGRPITAAKDPVEAVRRILKEMDG